MQADLNFSWVHMPEGIFSKIAAQTCNDPKYWDRWAEANSVDPDQMPKNAASD